MLPKGMLERSFIAHRQTTTVGEEATLAASVRFVRCDATGGAFTVTLPPARAMLGEVVTLKKVDASANAVTVDADGSETIDGSATYDLAAQYDAVSVRSSGSGWDITGVA